MNEHPGWPQPMPWVNAFGETFLWLISVQHPSSQEPFPFQVCYTKWKCWKCREEEGLHTHRYMYQRPVGIRGVEYAHLNQDKQAYFINQLFIIEYISAIHYLVGVAYFFLSPKTGLRTEYLGAAFLGFISPVSLQALDVNFPATLREMDSYLPCIQSLNQWWHSFNCHIKTFLIDMIEIVLFFILL